MLTRRQMIAGAAAAVGSGFSHPLNAAGSVEWRKISPSDAGFASDLEGRLDHLITSCRAWKLHGVVILRKGALVLERYDAGEDVKCGAGQLVMSPSARRRCMTCA